MSRTRSKKRRPRRPNKGWFKSGPDPRRSNYRPTEDECRAGFEQTISRHPHLCDWLKLRVIETKRACARRSR